METQPDSTDRMNRLVSSSVTDIYTDIAGFASEEVSSLFVHGIS
jgi:hypothetical protein